MPFLAIQVSVSSFCDSFNAAATVCSLYTHSDHGVSSAYWLFLPFASYIDERVLFVFGICLLHLELEGSKRIHLCFCFASIPSFLKFLCAFPTFSLLFPSQLLYIPDLI